MACSPGSGSTSTPSCSSKTCLAIQNPIPLASQSSRKHEFEADEFAAHQTNAGHLVSALVKLYKDNASTLTPDPIYSAFYYSHPPAAQRIDRLLSYA